MSFVHPHFAEPRWLWLAILAPLGLVILHRYAAWARRRQMTQFTAPRFVEELTRSHSPARRALKSALLVAVVTCLGVALARPQWGEETWGTTQWAGEDIVFALDCSRSMLATDVAPSRLQRAKLSILDFVRRRDLGRIGLVAFAGQAFLQCPLTFDYGAFEDTLLAIDDKTIPIAGTDLGRGLDEAFRAMEKGSRRKIVVLLTDGEDLEKGGVRTAEALAKQGVVVFAVGVGTAAGTAIQVLNEQGQPEVVRDSKGEVVRSRLDEATLQAIARATHGDYFPLGPLGEGLAKIQSSLNTMNATMDTAPTRKRGVDRFHLPVAAALALLVAESLMGTRRRTDRNVVTQ